MAKHTAGPWEATANYRSVIASSVKDNPAVNGCFAICELFGPDAPANGDLIAAAPDMRRVLLKLRESAAYWSEYDVPLGIVDEINAAVAKSYGVTVDALDSLLGVEE